MQISSIVFLGGWHDCSPSNSTVVSMVVVPLTP